LEVVDMTPSSSE